MSHLILNMGVFVVLLPLVVAVFRYRNLSGSQRWLVLMLAIVATNQLLAKGLIYFFHINNLPFFHLYIAVESFFLLWLFRYELSWRLKERWLKAGGLIMVGLVLINGLWVQPFTEFPSNIRALESVVIIGLCLLYFYFTLEKLSAVKLEQSFMFWLSSGLVLYFGGNLMLFIFSNYVGEQEREVFIQIWTIHSVLNIILYTMYAIALLCRDPHQK